VEERRRNRLVKTSKLPLETPAPLPPEDVKWSNVSLFEILNRGTRLEAGVYGIEGKHAREVLSRCRWELKTLTGEDGLATAYRPGICTRIFVKKENGIPMFTPAQISELKPRPARYLSPKTKTDLSSWYLREGEIALTCSGTIGDAAYVSRTLAGKLFSQNMIRLVPQENAGYIYAFLRTEIGQAIIKTSNYGAVIQHIDPEHLSDIPIPNPAPIIKSTIHNLIADSFRLRDESNELIDEAGRLLVDELSLPPIEKIKVKKFDPAAECQSYGVKLSELAGRFEPTYHRPIVQAIHNHIKKQAAEVTTLGDNRISKDIILPGRFKRVYVGEYQGVVFFGGKELLNLDPSGEKFLSLKHHSGRITGQLTIKENMIMVTCSGTIGKVALAPKHWEGWTANQHILRVVPANDDIAGYIYTWLASDYGHELITRFTYGAVVHEIDNQHISRVQIPLLKNQETQNRINALVLEANRKRSEAYLLELEAIQTTNKQVIFAEK
jgi:type I restriction enzyme, S subunit